MVLDFAFSFMTGNISVFAKEGDTHQTTVFIDRQKDLDRRIALIIGNSAYQFSPLKNPENDAVDMSEALERLGYSVTVLTNATFLDMGRAINAFGNELKKGGVGLFFYAGHGVQVNGRNYLIPVDSNINHEEDIPYITIDANLVLSKMESAGNSLNIIMLDACRNNPYAKSFRSLNRGLATMDAPTGSLIVYATAPGSVAADGSRRNGIFTECLLQHIFTPSLDVELMLRNVRRGVITKTHGQQVPWTASSLQSSFSFVPGSVRAITVTPAPLPEKPAPPRFVMPPKPPPDLKRLVFEAEGKSDHDDPISRKVFSKKAALKNIRKQIVKSLTRKPHNFNKSEALAAYEKGEITDLEYGDSGKSIYVEYEIFIVDRHLKK
ncbi:MAG: caspase family protein [Bacteroidetes bacterium]|nr:caspase family protein [Bacteroidota bacterium]